MGNITIKLMSDLCAGNGSSVGYGVDNDICADNFGFPFIPARRILGCLRESSEKLREYGLDIATEENINSIFGNENGKEGALSIDNAYINGIESMHGYIMSLKEDYKDYLIRQSTEDKMIRLFSSVRGQTKISDDGKAEAGSLRFIRVLNQYNPITGKPFEFVSKVNTLALNDEQIKLLEMACKSLRHIGMDRNRGLGSVIIIPDFKGEAQESDDLIYEDNSTQVAEKVCFRYQLRFDSPIALQEYLENGSQIRARTMIGAFSSIYLKKYGKNEDVFKKLFLDGSVRWSALNPVICGLNSNPAPSMIMKLKNENGKLINAFSNNDGEWKKKKPKTLEGFFASVDEEKDKVYISEPEIEINYHNRISEQDGKKTGLYMQESLRQGMIYGGYVIAPYDCADSVKELLMERNIQLGRSKKVQYGNVKMLKVQKTDCCSENVSIDDGESVFAILKSDLIVTNDAAVRIDNAFIRQLIAEKTGLYDEIPEGMYDICRYHVLSGYHSMWHMQKPKTQAVMGGSVYCFTGKKGSYSSTILLGEYLQEGFGIIEIIPMSKMNRLSNVEYGNLSMYITKIDQEIKNQLENLLLVNAAKSDIQEYAFAFKKKWDIQLQEAKKQNKDKKVPVGRLRQMLLDSNSIEDFCEMVESMKTSDVSSESEGKKKNSEDLLIEFYGGKTENDKLHLEMDITRFIKDKDLVNALNNNPLALSRVKTMWKEPLSILLHMIHYGKGAK